MYLSRESFIVKHHRRAIESAAIKKVSEKYKMVPKEVKRLIHLAGLFSKSRFEPVDEHADLFAMVNSVEMLAVGGQVKIHYILILLSMREHGHISERQWVEIVLPKYEREINKYIKYRDERRKNREEKTYKNT